MEDIGYGLPKSWIDEKVKRKTGKACTTVPRPICLPWIEGVKLIPEYLEKETPKASYIPIELLKNEELRPWHIP